MHERVCSPSRKVIKFYQPRHLESKNSTQLPAGGGDHDTLKTSQSSPSGPGPLQGSSFRSAFITPFPCTQRGHAALKSLRTTGLFRFANTSFRFAFVFLRLLVNSDQEEGCPFCRLEGLEGKVLLTNATTCDSNGLLD